MNNAQKLLAHKLLYEGESFDTFYGVLTITKYDNAKNITVKFNTTGYETVTRLDHILSGQVKDKLLPSVVGVGITGDEVVSRDGKLTQEYLVWKSMLLRCYDKEVKMKQPTYIECRASENFKFLEYFSKWCNKQIGFKNNNWQLDKDILVKGNKIYSEDTCCFVPMEINVALTKSDKSRGKYLVGVTLNKQGTGYVARVQVGGGKRKHLGTYATQTLAFAAYKQGKEDYIKSLANKWKDQIDPRVYEALMGYQVEITD